MSKLTKVQIDELVANAGLFLPIYLMADGYKITLKQIIVDGKLRVQLYINGVFKGKWITKLDGDEEGKFFMPWVSHKKCPYTGKRRKIEINMRRPYFASFGQALRHINKISDNVEVCYE